MKEKNIESYKFKRSDLISANQMRSLQSIHDRFARNFSSAASGYLRTAVEVSLETIEQMDYAQFLSGIADPTCYGVISLKPLDGIAAVELTPQIVFPMIDRLLGGSGQTLQTIRPMTEIEQSIMQKVLKLLVDSLKESWRPMHPVDFAVSSIENHPQMAQVVSSSEMVVRFTFQVRMRQTIAKMHLVFPTLVLAPVIQVSDQEWQSKKKVANDKTLLLQLPRIPVNVTIETGETRFPMQALLSLQAGDTLVLDQREEWPVQLKVSGRKKFQAAPKTGSSKKSFVISGHNRPVREEARDGSIS